MNPIYQPCPACGRTLELPGDAMGRLGKCPACDATFTIGVTPAAPGVSQASAVTTPDDSPLPPSVQQARSVYQTPAAEPQADAPPAAAPQVDAPQAAETPPEGDGQAGSPLPPGQHPFSVPLGAGTTEGESYHRSPAPVMQPVTQMTKLEIGRCSIEQVLSPTIAVFAARWSSLVVAFLIVGAVMAFLIFIPLLVISSIADAGGDTAAGVLTLMWVPIMVVVGSFFAVGFSRATLAVARSSHPNPTSELTPPFSLVLRFFGGALLLGVALGLLGIVFAAVVGGLISVAGNERLASFLSLMAAFLASVFSLLVLWLFWSWLWIVSDGKGTAIGSLRTAYKVTMHNKLTSAMLVLIAVVLTAIGTVLCNIGHLVTVPLTMLMYAVAYLVITGQGIDDPRGNFTPHDSPPPARPTF